jgi:exodeoxyribonuclease-3
MKIATFNINNVNKRLANLFDWLREARPDVACLQELKATDSEFPIPGIKRAGYGAVWRGQKSWNGVAILARDGEPVLTRKELPGDPTDEQSRYIEAVGPYNLGIGSASKFIVVACYAPKPPSTFSDTPVI